MQMLPLCGLLAGMIAAFGPTLLRAPIGTCAPQDSAVQFPGPGAAHAPAAHGDEFRAHHVEFAGGSADVLLAGTLLLPRAAAADQRVPGVVLVTGSGVQDRDETVMGAKPFKVLAEALAARGYAVLRYDDRGSKGLNIGHSTGDAAVSTLADTATDAAAAMAFLAGRQEVLAEKIALCGHSTGGLEVSMLLGRGLVPGAAVLLAAPCVRGAELLAYQSTELAMAAHKLGRSGMTDEQAARMVPAQAELILAYVSDDEQRLARAAETVVRAAAAMQGLGDSALTSEVLQTGVNQTLAPLRQAWMNHFLRYDPAADLQAATVPVLAVFGGRDLQVAPVLNTPAISAALARSGNPQSEIVILPTCNHLFQEAVTGLTDEYGSLTGEMGKRLSSIVCDWLDQALTTNQR